MPHRGGRVAIFTAAQETLIVDMVSENNLIRLREIRDKVVADNVNFESIDDVSLATIDRVLRRQKMRMKQVYMVPFEGNSARHKDLCYEYVQRILQLDAMARPHEYLFLDEAGFNLQKRRQRGRNIIGQRAITEVPGQRGGNITLCAAMGSEGLVHRHAVLGSYNTQRLLTFLEEPRDILLDRQQHHPGPAHHIYVIIWDNVHFHRTNQIREWFTTNSNQFLNVCLPPYSPFLNPIEEFFSSWRWKVYDRQPYTKENLLRAMELACVDIPVEAFQGWIRHSRAFFPWCLARDNIACDVDEVMWPDAAQRHDAAQ
ncbi:receptor-type tyrosine- phosphatase U-like protein [Labeo rohita]|uniref:Receptor-type tyrosine-phosphatase U-like protein n=1 Tax=Labeo rohita TaxID=84645 RepID=A0A498NFP0_LABRO|nr:receptor-type tyrosine- phosphatase U-like protein [Labeo rohita]RXN30626.1 receptor-type tyrosine- phosphatase U-like protein [Labeo rohita]